MTRRCELNKFWDFGHNMFTRNKHRAWRKAKIAFVVRIRARKIKRRKLRAYWRWLFLMHLEHGRILKCCGIIVNWSVGPTVTGNRVCMAAVLRTIKVITIKDLGIAYAAEVWEETQVCHHLSSQVRQLILIIYILGMTCSG